ncbi:MAG: SMP-30/gluconolactonase/LRE family protein [Pseudomonadota bacterium]
MTLFSPLATLSSTASRLIESHCELGESPRWNAHEARLYWVDIAANAMHRWDSRSGFVESRTFDAPAACFAFRKSGGMVLGMKNGCALIDGWGDVPRPFGEQVLAGKPHHRMNDGRCDPAGNFWVGSVNGAKTQADAALYRLSTAGELIKVESGMMTCNGAAFYSGGTRFCHADTPSHAVRAYDCDAATGALSNRHILHQFEVGVGPGLGRPDGGSFDEEGCYWTALFDGWRIVRLSPAGEIIVDIRLPVQRPTMIAFGGVDRRTAFVTSARTGLSEAQLADQPQAGDVFAFRVDVPGVAEFAFGG